MRFRFGAALTALVIPALLAGQGGMGGMGGMGGGRGGGRMGDMGDMGDRGGPPNAQKLATLKEIEALNPAQLLIDKRKKLSLADSQVAALKLLQGRIYERNADLLVSYDSIRKEIKIPDGPAGGGGMGGGRGGPPSGGGGASMSDEEMAALKSRMQALMAVTKQLRARRQVDVAETLTLVGHDQLKKANELLVSQTEEFDSLLPRSRDVAPRPPESSERERR